VQFSSNTGTEFRRSKLHFSAASKSGILYSYGFLLENGNSRNRNKKNVQEKGLGFFLEKLTMTGQDERQ